MKSKPSNLKYTDLCIYIDNTVYERDENNNPIGLRRLTSIEEETVYNYLYNIIIALAHKKKLFPYKDVNQYNDFSSMFATKLYMRITSQKQDFSNTRSRMRPIKSVLNLIKKVIGYAAIDFRNDNYQQILNPEYDELEKIDTVSEYSQDIIRSQYERPQHEIFIYVFVDIAKYVDKVVNKSFFNRNKRESSNLKLSVLLSIERFVTLPHNIKNKSTPKKAKLLQKQVDN